MDLKVKIVLILKLIFILSAFLKVMTRIHSKKDKLKIEVRISRMLYYNASLLLFLYWFNPWKPKTCLEGEERILVFSFVVIECIQEFFPHLI
jgi:hypothetical protein